MPKHTTRENNTVNSVSKAFRIVEFLRETGGARLTEIAEEFGWAKSTTHNYLRTLELNEYVVKEGTTYHLSFKFLSLSEHVLNRDELYPLARKKVNHLAEKTGERVQFVVHEHEKAVYVHHEVGGRGVDTDAATGSRLDLHGTSSGKAILAHLPREERQELIEKIELTQHTEETITDKDVLRAELEEIREETTAFTYSEMVLDMNAVAAPIMNSDGQRVLGALSISGPAHRMTESRMEDELAEDLLGTTNELELNVKYL